jgi:hypothetical protein
VGESIELRECFCPGFSRANQYIYEFARFSLRSYVVTHKPLLPANSHTWREMSCRTGTWTNVTTVSIVLSRSNEDISTGRLVYRKTRCHHYIHASY